ncbi:MAG: uroporphyrinogen decarboxylase [Cyanobacteria bacterium NC_groundwater_1444_Ag_S-0.65um_54_12]|nr:uroporphyrinogen decarboxylase [Cyanobacteria bacterium NC_groundwater_1444_Ag_S-0.65um_54_12]
MTDLALTTSRILAAARRQGSDRPPVWIMRQAGRYLPEYRAVRERYDFMQLCKVPELAVEVSLQPVERLKVDAAILFSDILIPLEAMGLEVVFTEHGPQLPGPVRTLADIQRLGIPDPLADFPFQAETVRLLARALADKVPVIGFAGAPFTLAAYAVEGGGSKNFHRTKRLMHCEPAAFASLLDKLAQTVAATLSAQVAAGAKLVQIFDSWGGELNKADYRAFSLPATRQIVRTLRAAGVPVILYLGGGPHLVDLLVETEADVLSLDWRSDLGEVLDRWGDRIAVQGNLDPALLFASPERIRREVMRIRAQVGGRAGHIWNLGHGILPDTPVEHAQAFVEAAQGNGQ